MTTTTLQANPKISGEAPVSGSEPPKTSSARLAYVDGLRACAILLVLGWHQYGRLTGAVGFYLNGWVGVDLFFVIGGFLITSILLIARAKTGSFNTYNFYVRRWLRIFPAYYCFLAFMMVGCFLFNKHADITANLAAFATVALYVTNLDLAFGWNRVPPGTGLFPTWSLPVQKPGHGRFKLVK